MRNRFLYLVFIIAFTFSYGVNELNLHYIKVNHLEANTVFGYTVYSIDNKDYTTPIKNILNGDGFTLDPKNPEMYVRRTPVYPLFYGAHYWLFGEKNSFRFIRYTQTFLFGLSAVLLGLLVFNFTNNAKWAKNASILYCLNPFVASYTYFTITEAITPFMVILSLFCFSNYYTTKNKWWYLLAGFSSGLLLLHRASAAVILLGFVAVILLENFKSSVKKTILYLTILFSGFSLCVAPWFIRNYIITDGEIIIAEKFYYESPMYYGRGATYFMKWISCWGNSTDYINKFMLNIPEDSLNKSAINNHINKTLNTFPEYAFNGSSKPEIKNALHQLVNCYYYRNEMIKKQGFYNHKALGNLKCDYDVKVTFQESSSNYKSKSKFRFYVIKPLTMLKELVMQSCSHNIVSLNAPTLTLWQKALKALLMLLNILLYLSLPIYFLIRGNNTGLGIIIFISFTGTFVFFGYILASWETRYFLPTLPFLYITMSYFFSIVFSKVYPK